jgi:hypothetical protein
VIVGVGVIVGVLVGGGVLVGRIVWLPETTQVNPPENWKVKSAE